jgi:hypothetical protein
MKKRGVEGYQYEMDDGDDQYMVYPVRGDYHMHIRSELVFRPTKNVSLYHVSFWHLEFSVAGDKDLNIIIYIYNIL